ncbi:MAG TPA: hypothetical protein VMZ50_02270 [Phycisphaerae bacterium]|nr:hypothetical protein [Phycisphaerae bacterium]
MANGNAGYLRGGTPSLIRFRSSSRRRKPEEDEEAKRHRIDLEAAERAQSRSITGDIIKAGVGAGTTSTTTDEVRRALNSAGGRRDGDGLDMGAKRYRAMDEREQERGRFEQNLEANRARRAQGMAQRAEANRNWQLKKDTEAAQRFKETGGEWRPSIGFQATPDTPYRTIEQGRDFSDLSRGGAMTQTGASTYGQMMEEGSTAVTGQAQVDRASRVRGLQDFQRRVRELQGQLPGYQADGELPGERAAVRQESPERYLHPMTERLSSEAGQEMAAMDREPVMGGPTSADIDQRLQQFRIPTDETIPEGLRGLQSDWQARVGQYQRNNLTVEAARDKATKDLMREARSNPWTESDVRRIARFAEQPTALPVQIGPRETMVPTQEGRQITYEPPQLTPAEISRAGNWTEPLSRMPTGAGTGGGIALGGKSPAQVAQERKTAMTTAGTSMTAPITQFTSGGSTLDDFVRAAAGIISGGDPAMRDVREAAVMASIANNIPDAVMQQQATKALANFLKTAAPTGGGGGGSPTPTIASENMNVSIQNLTTPVKLQRGVGEAFTGARIAESMADDTNLKTWIRQQAGNLSGLMASNAIEDQIVAQLEAALRARFPQEVFMDDPPRTTASYGYVRPAWTAADKEAAFKAAVRNTVRDILKG